MRWAERLGLSGRLFAFTVVSIMLAEVAFYVPSIANMRINWLMDRLASANTAAVVLKDKYKNEVKVSDELVFHRTALEELRRLVAAQKAKSPKMDVATFKELTGVSRKYAIPLLEYLDRERVTRRVGDAREIL